MSEISPLMRRVYWLLLRIHYVLTAPVAAFFILASARIHPGYRMTPLRKLGLGLRMLYNTARIRTGTSFKSHLAMALKIFETPPDVAGDVVECGTWLGGTAANLSLVCAIVGRKMIVYDSFEGLPEGDPSDREAKYYKKGDYSGSLDEVRRNVERFGRLDVCEFRKGWFDATLPRHDSPILLVYLDVDLEASLHDCLRHLWPHLIDRGYVFIDECANTDYCAVFYSETYWRRYFDRRPPGLIGAGVGLALGEYYIGPYSDREAHPLEHSNTGAYTRKDFSGYWAYYPEGDRSAPRSVEG